MALERHIAGQRPDWAKWPKAANDTTPSWVRNRRPMIHAVRRRPPMDALMWEVTAKLALIVAAAERR